MLRNDKKEALDTLLSVHKLCQNADYVASYDSLFLTY